MKKHTKSRSKEVDSFSCPGFKAAGVSCGTKKSKKKDLALIICDTPAVVAGVFTKSKVRAAPVLIDQKRVRRLYSRGVVVNSGKANACTGALGLRNAEQMVRSVEQGLGLKSGEILIASTGSIGTPFPLEELTAKVPVLLKGLSPEGFVDAAEAIMTTDAFSKRALRRSNIGGREVTILGIAKGAGMIRPDMATMLAFFCTDARIGKKALGSALRASVDASFNSINVDNDTSTNDTVLIFANGVVDGPEIKEGSRAYNAFVKELSAICLELAHLIVRDGEGATKFVEITVKGAASLKDAKKATIALSESYLVKTALFGGDPNWGRILAVLGRAGIKLDQNKVDISMGGVKVAKNSIDNGREKEAARALKATDIEIVCDLKLGKFSNVRWSTDLSHAYVELNSAYRT